MITGPAAWVLVGGAIIMVAAPITVMVWHIITERRYRRRKVKDGV